MLDHVQFQSVVIVWVWHLLHCMLSTHREEACEEIFKKGQSKRLLGRTLQGTASFYLI